MVTERRVPRRGVVWPTWWHLALLAVLLFSTGIEELLTGGNGHCKRYSATLQVLKYLLLTLWHWALLYSSTCIEVLLTCGGTG